MICTFFGHKDTPNEITQSLRATLIELIEKQDVKIFLVGNNGNFDSIVRNQLADLIKLYPIKYYVVLAYIPTKTTTNNDPTIYPECLEAVPKKFAIDYRNRWMVEQADYVVTHVTYSFGGAYKFKELSHKKNKEVINI